MQYSKRLTKIMEGLANLDMRDPERIPEILEKLSETWVKFPDLRLGQLLLNVFSDPQLYYIEDKDLVEGLRSYYKTKMPS